MISELEDLFGHDATYQIFKTPILQHKTIDRYCCQISELLDFLSPATDFYYKQNSKNRAIDTDRVATMIEIQRNNIATQGVMTLISADIILGYLIPKDKYLIIDGQHRITALKDIIEDNPDYGRWNITFTVYKADSEMDLHRYYRQVNSGSVAVPAYYFDDFAQKVIDNVVESLAKKYNFFFKTTKTQQRPFMNKIPLKEAFSSNDKFKYWIELNNDKSPVELSNLLIEMIESYNSYLSKKDAIYFRKSQSDKSYLRLHSKAFTTPKPLYLGMIPNYLWISDIIK